MPLPGGARGRVRAIQAHDHPVERATGGRVALALAGVARAQAPRGACVVGEGDGWEPTGTLDVALTWLPGAGGPLRTRRRLQAFLGTAEVPTACVLLQAESLAPGEAGPVQLRLERPVVARAGDRVVLRSAERRTVGGGVVGDAQPLRRGRRRAARAATTPPAPALSPRPARAAPPPPGLAAAAALLSQAGLRHALALAGHLDATGITRREGEVRVLRRGARPG